ncbi:MAG TPA: FkbM family methyltransferase [Opitutaceae bacterium]|nr:FkbM family methyltransferase [Opitutaceae bacterium]
MNPVLRALDRTAAAVNDLPLWRSECRVWGQRMAPTTFERWLYLRMHRWRLMGGEDRAFLQRAIRPGMRVLDVGSNLGLYSVLAARLAGEGGRVICFEPDARLHAALRRNLAANGLARVETHAVALGAAAGEMEFHRSVINSGDNHLGVERSALFRRRTTVPVVRLDDYLPGLALDLVKLDVQGWELNVLRGMPDILAANRNLQIHFEFSDMVHARAGEPWQELIACLRQAGFRIFNPLDHREFDDQRIAELGRSLARRGYTNLLASRHPPGAPS